MLEQRFSVWGSNDPFTSPKTTRKPRYLHHDSSQQQNYSQEVATKLTLQLGVRTT